MNASLGHILWKWDLDPQQDMPIEIPESNRVTLARLFAELDYRTGAEIGTYSGSFAITLSINIPKLKLYCVDPWTTYDGLNDYTDADYLNEIYQLAVQRLRQYKGVEIIRELSMDAVKKFDDESLDFVYIDANHEFPFVAEDIFYWSKKVRPGGIVSGHDYLKTPRKDGMVQVKEVVHAYTEAFNINPWFLVSDQHENKSFLWVKT
ncbi:MAG: class I SAM-dependent methyltransferase [Planctomycetota bacterium]|jgi:predicted O-methyltransferase YrrM